MNDKYPWAANMHKLGLSIVAVTNRAKFDGEELTEEAVKEDYVRRGGLLLNEDGTKGEPFAAQLSEVAEVAKPVVDDVAPTEDFVPSEGPVEEVAPKKVRKSSKK